MRSFNAHEVNDCFQAGVRVRHVKKLTFVHRCQQRAACQQIAARYRMAAQWQNWPTNSRINSSGRLVPHGATSRHKPLQTVLCSTSVSPKKLAPPWAPACFPSNSATQAISPALQITASSPQAPFPSVPFCRFGALRSEAFLRPREATWLESLPNWARTWFLMLWTRLWRSFSRRTVSSRAAA